MNLKIRKVTGTISVAKKKFRRKPFFAISPFLCFGPKWKFRFGRTFEFFHRKLLLTVFTSCCWCCIYSEEIFAGIMSPGKVELLQPWPLSNNSPSRLLSFDRTNTDNQAWKINEPHHDAIEPRLCCCLHDPSLLSLQAETKKKVEFRHFRSFEKVRNWKRNFDTRLDFKFGKLRPRLRHRISNLFSLTHFLTLTQISISNSDAVTAMSSL